MTTHMDRRALDYVAKREIVSRLLDAWERMPELRLGQLIVNSLDESDDLANLYYKEDFDLIDQVDTFVNNFADTP